MAEVWHVARLISVLALVGGGVWLGWLLYEHPGVGVRARILALSESHERKLRFLRWRARGTQVVAVQGALWLVALYVAIEVSGAVASLLVVLPWLVSPLLNAKVNQRLDRLDQQLEGWLGVLASALTSSASLGQALGETAGMIEAPLRDEVERVSRELRVGVSVADALDRMARRVGSTTLATAIAAIRIGQQTGGGLAQTLRLTAATLREMARLEGVVRTRTAEGKAQATVVAVIPLPMVGFIHTLDPNLMRPLWENPRGTVVVVVAVFLWGASILLARKILDVDI